MRHSSSSLCLPPLRRVFFLSECSGEWVVVDASVVSSIFTYKHTLLFNIIELNSEAIHFSDNVWEVFHDWWACNCIAMQRSEAHLSWCNLHASPWFAIRSRQLRTDTSLERTGSIAPHARASLTFLPVYVSAQLSRSNPQENSSETMNQ